MDKELGFIQMELSMRDHLKMIFSMDKVSKLIILANSLKEHLLWGADVPMLAIIIRNSDIYFSLLSNHNCMLFIN